MDKDVAVTWAAGQRPVGRHGLNTSERCYEVTSLLKSVGEGRRWERLRLLELDSARRL